MITQALFKLISRIPRSRERDQLSGDPQKRAQVIARTAALKAAGLSGSLAIPPGPLGLATVLPDLVAIWRIQQAMVADIAAVYGQSVALTRESMVYCLFKHAGTALTRDLVVRIGERYLVQQAALKAMQKILRRIGVRLSRRIIGKSILRWVPVLGAVGVGAYAYYDTAQVAATAIALFSKQVAVSGDSAVPPLLHHA